MRPLISHRLRLARPATAYDLLADRTQASLGIILEYRNGANAAAVVRDISLRAGAPRTPRLRVPAVAFIGAGNYAGRVLIPAFRAGGARLFAVATANGINAARYGRRYGFESASTDAEAVLAAPEVDASSSRPGTTPMRTSCSAPWPPASTYS